MEIPGLRELRASHPASGEALERWAAQLVTRLDAAEWAMGHAPQLAHGARATALETLVALAREETGAADAWALWWTGDLAAGQASLRLVTGAGEALPAPEALSRTVLATTARTGRPTWAEDARLDPRFQGAASVMAQALMAVGCLPVGPDAALYLANPAAGRFRSRSRARLEALCGLLSALSAREPAPAPTARLPGLVGESPPMRELFAAIRAFAPVPWPALVLGETGTGKEAVARALHALSPRASAPFVAINCAAVPDELAESTFFGHEKGAFTGADRRKDGLLERAGAGTLFLDELGELSPRVQAKLLRVLQEGSYERLGGATELRFEGRIVAATLRPLDRADKGGFRADLYHRLAGCVLRVPTLAERRQDIPALATALLGKAQAQLPGAEYLTLSNTAIQALVRRDWPGNVRELENQLRAALARALATGASEIGPEHLDAAPLPSPDPEAPAAGGLLDATDRFQRALVRQAIAAANGNKAEAAEALGVSRQWLHRLLTRWGGRA